MKRKKFDHRKLEKLNNPERLRDIPPDFIWSRLNMNRADGVVEIGAGTAFFSIAFLPYAKPSRVYACDVSEVMIDWMKRHVVSQYPVIVPVETGEDSLPLDDGVADLVFMINLHHELKSPVRTLGEAYRVLKPGGKIFIVDWKKIPMGEGPPFSIRCLPGEVVDALRDSKFENVKNFDELPRHFLIVGEKSRTRLGG